MCTILKYVCIFITVQKTILFNVLRSIYKFNESKNAHINLVICMCGHQGLLHWDYWEFGILGRSSRMGVGRFGTYTCLDTDSMKFYSAYRENYDSIVTT